MKNKEKYAEELLEFCVLDNSFKITLNGIEKCDHCDCSGCALRLQQGKCEDFRKEWLEQEYVEPEIDWSKVPVDTPVIVTDSNGVSINAYFYQYSKELELPLVFADGKSSWTSKDHKTEVYEKTRPASIKLEWIKIKGVIEFV